MKIALLLQDSNFENLDLSHPEEGNMGIGGTQYCFLILARYLSIYYPELDIYIYHFSNNALPKGVTSVKIQHEEEAIYISKKDKIDILIMRNGNLGKLSSIITACGVPTIIWAHNYLFSDELDLINRNENIKRLVFVGKEQYDRYIDHPVINKATYIYNMFNSDNKLYARNQNYDLNVCYVGSLVPSKGFHLIAEQWKKIIREVPDANLYVIGSGNLYNRNSILGKHGIAEANYEEKFLSYLSIDGKLLESVHFCGILGQEKFEIFNNTAVGIINPTGKTETFGISAVEMEACGVPIVTVGKNGLLDTVIHEETGLLFKKTSGMRRNIVKLLQDRNLNNKLGMQAKRFVNQTFSPEKIIKEWYNLFFEIQNNSEAEYKEPRKNFSNNMKRFRIINRKLKKTKMFSWLAPIIDIETGMKKIVINLKRTN